MLICYKVGLNQQYGINISYMFLDCINLTNITNFINHGFWSDDTGVFDGCTELTNNSFTQNSVINRGNGLNYIYIDIPEDQMEPIDFLTLNIEFANEDDFSDSISFDLTDCQVFNPAAGTWVTIKDDEELKDGLSINFERF